MLQGTYTLWEVQRMEIRGKWRKEEEGGRRKGEGREGRRKREDRI